MSSFETSQPRIVKLQLQPNFPNEDLNDDNTAMLRFSLPKHPSVEAYASELKDSQNYIQLVANRALKFLDIKTEDSERALSAFSHGFTSLEVISDLVHAPRIYDMTLARDCVERFFVDTRSLLDIEFEELMLSVAENRPMVEISHDRPGAEIELANRHDSLPGIRPNTFDVVIAMGTARGENVPQLQARVAGATLAYNFQTID